VPVVPVAIRGTRSILRGEQWFPRRGRIRVEVAPPLAPGGDGLREAVRLREAARHELLARCGEPDLGESLPGEASPPAGVPAGSRPGATFGEEQRQEPPWSG
jgi:1-acyl-sn-glycerol-3-phosphate acyltransferase